MAQTISEKLLKNMLDSFLDGMTPQVVHMIDDTVEHTAATITIPKGMTIYGHFNSIELDSGKVLAYARKGIVPVNAGG